LTQEYVARKLGKTPQWSSNTKRETGPIPADELAGLASAIEVESVKFILQFIPKFVEN
jgi:hypothetical protein